jgi:hypothetical protein
VTLLHAVEIGLLQEGALPMGAHITPDYMEHARGKLNELVDKAHSKISWPTLFSLKVRRQNRS